MPASSHVLDPIWVTFDDDNAVADAGLLLSGTLVKRLGLERVADERVTRGYRPGRKLLTIVSTLLAGGDCIGDVDLLRAGATSKIVGHDTVAASTVETWLRSLTFGHIRQLDAVTEAALTRAWQAGAGPGDAPMFIDVDSTICEVHGRDKHGAGYGYTRVLGYHPLLATRADTGEVLHTRMRKGSANTARGAQRFVRETIGRVRRAGARGKLTLRADSGFWSHKVMNACVDHGVDFSITVRAQKHVVATIDAIDDNAWVDIDYTDRGIAQVAETVLEFDDRAHAVQELVIRDLKHGAGLNHCPSGIFNANAAWLIATSLAHNLARWIDVLGVRGQHPSSSGGRTSPGRCRLGTPAHRRGDRPVLAPAHRNEHRPAPASGRSRPHLPRTAVQRAPATAGSQHRQGRSSSGQPSWIRPVGTDAQRGGPDG